MGNKTNKETDPPSRTLPDSHTLRQIAHLYHWNVVGPRFIPLHTFFEQQ
jgi:DNA-binding ferritin-like protein